MGYEALFTPLNVGTVTVPNRVQMAPMTRNRAPNAIPSDMMKEYYVQRAKGGAALIVSEGVLVVGQGQGLSHTFHYTVSDLLYYLGPRGNKPLESGVKSK
jgi:2,4-dienoyl-CoA reductase-like NADH-dependent reductase (Old Yellow Enzyme family)